MKAVVEWVWLGVGGYLLLGLGFAGVFHVWGLGRVDSATQSAGLGFRLLITPGIAALWPLMAWRWKEHGAGRVMLGGAETPISPHRLRTWHRLLWQGMLVLIPLLLAASWIWQASPIPPTPLPIQGSSGPLILPP